jgi:cytochrome P450
MPFIQDLISVAPFLQENAFAIAGMLSLTLVYILYHLSSYPLSHVPGPFLAKISSLPLYTLCFLGIEGRILRTYHQKYNTKVLRVAPNSVSISDSSAIRDIYQVAGGFEKDARYTNFNLGPVVSIFSATDTAYRDRRAKAVAPLFAPVRLRAASESGGVIAGCVEEFVDQLRAFKEAGLKVDIVDLCARLSIDVVTEYLLGQRYGGLREHSDLSVQAKQDQKLSANPFIFAIVAFSRFSLLPNRLFKLLYSLSSRLNSSPEVVKSFMKLDQFVNRVMGAHDGGKATAEGEMGDTGLWYHKRLLQAGIEPGEAAAQSKAIVFAGGDSTAVMLATILFHLVQNPKISEGLLEEIQRSKTKGNGSIDAQALPYLRAVVKEGLRLGMANPTRLTRVVPSTGLRIGNISLPPGTVVGCAAYMLHHDVGVFPEPFAFLPERWLENSELHRPEMDRSMMPFGAGFRACIGKNLAQQQLYEAVVAVIGSGVLVGAKTCQARIEMIEWFNGEIKGHHLDIEWK